MGELSLLRTSGTRVAAGACIALLAVAVSTRAQPVTVSFTMTDTIGIWPPEAIKVDVLWDGGVSPAQCEIENLTNGDLIVRALAAVDSATSSVTIPFVTGWSLARIAAADTTLQAFYGEVIVASVEGVTDTVRLGCELARLTLSPAQVSVDTTVTLTLHDRDFNARTDTEDTVRVSWRSGGHQADAYTDLAETGSSTGSFTSSVPVVCALDLNPPTVALAVLDADTLQFSLWDSLADASGWEQPEGRSVGLVHPIATSTARLALSHDDYGDISILPLDGDAIEVRLYEPDLAGIGTMAARVTVAPSQGGVRDSITTPLVESERGWFAGSLSIGGQGLEAQAGDTLCAEYMDRADAFGAVRAIRVSSLLGARVVAGAVADTLWSPESPVLLVDSVTVPAGHQLRVAPGCMVAVVPNRGLIWRIDGTVEIGGAQADSVLITSAARLGNPGDWGGIVVAGRLWARHTAISHAETGVQGLEGAVIELEESRVHRCGSGQAALLSLWQRSRGAGAMGELARNASALPAGISSAGSCTISHTIVEHGAGFGLVLTGGNCTLTGGALADNTLDGLLAADAVCDGLSVEIARNGQGGIYASGSSLTLQSAILHDNEIEGLYAAGGTSELLLCEVLGNRGGGFMARDGHRNQSRASLIAGNHRFGTDEAWGCSIGLDSSAVVGNGGSGMLTDYGSTLRASTAALAFNRRYGVSVGAWCVVDSLDARFCWWGTPSIPLDSTGTNCSLIWDGNDVPGRAVVQFVPWLTSPPPHPAPAELMPTGGERLAFVTGGGGPGDTLWLELTAAPGTGARYAGVAVASPLDTLLCVVLSDAASGGGVLRGRVVLTSSPDLSAPDRLAAGTANQVVAWWLADSTVRADATLRGEGPDATALVLLSAQPNPFSSHLRLSWAGSCPVVDLSLHDIAGRRRWQQREHGPCGITVVDPRVTATLQNGVYVAMLRTGNRSSRVRVIKIR